MTYKEKAYWHYPQDWTTAPPKDHTLMLPLYFLYKKRFFPEHQVYLPGAPSLFTDVLRQFPAES